MPFLRWKICGDLKGCFLNPKKAGKLHEFLILDFYFHRYICAIQWFAECSLGSCHPMGHLQFLYSYVFSRKAVICLCVYMVHLTLGKMDIKFCCCKNTNSPANRALFPRFKPIFIADTTYICLVTKVRLHKKRKKLIQFCSKMKNHWVFECKIFDTGEAHTKWKFFSSFGRAHTTHPGLSKQINFCTRNHYSVTGNC